MAQPNTQRDIKSNDKDVRSVSGSQAYGKDLNVKQQQSQTGMQQKGGLKSGVETNNRNLSSNTSVEDGEDINDIEDVDDTSSEDLENTTASPKKGNAQKFNSKH